MTHRALSLVRYRPALVLAKKFQHLRGLVIVEASERRFCVVCREGHLVARWLRWKRPVVTGCPHCSPAPGYHALPLIFLPTRQDIPREDSVA